MYRVQAHWISKHCRFYKGAEPKRPAPYFKIIIDMIVKCISMWQAWASAFLRPDLKLCETRHWSTNHRGPLVIHATKTLRSEAKAEWVMYKYWRVDFPDGIDKLHV